MQKSIETNKRSLSGSLIRSLNDESAECDQRMTIMFSSFICSTASVKLRQVNQFPTPELLEKDIRTFPGCRQMTLYVTGGYMSISGTKLSQTVF